MNPEARKEPLENTTDGQLKFYKHTVLQVGDIPILKTAVDNDDFSESIGRCIDNADGLIHDSSLGYEHCNEMLSIYGAILLRREEMMTTIETDVWEFNFARELFNRIKQEDDDIDDFLVPHDNVGLYYPITDSHVVRVAPVADPKYCRIEIDLYPVAEFNAAREELPIKPVSEEDRLDLLLEVADLWAELHDFAIEKYSDHKPKKDRLVQLSLLTTFNENSEESFDNQLYNNETKVNRDFDDIGGNWQAKKALEDCAEIMLNPELANQYGIRAPHILLYGPPGTGKTSMAQIFADKIDAETMSINTASVIDKWVGNSGKNMLEVFDSVHELTDNGKRVVVLFDEFEALASKSVHRSSSERTDVVKVLAQQISELEKVPSAIVIATTNSDIDDLEPALVRAGRLKTVPVPPPAGAHEQGDVWAAVLSRQNALFSQASTIGQSHRFSDDLDIFKLAEISDCLTGADIVEIINNARIEKFKHAVKTGESQPISQQDIVNALKKYRRN